MLSDGGLESRLGSPAPDVADRQREGVSGVRRCRRGRQPEQPGHHLRDLRLVGPTAARHRGLDLAGRVEVNRYAVPCSDDHRDAAGLSRAHDRADVVLAEDALDGDDIRAVLQDARLDLLLQLVQAASDVEVGGRAEHADVHHRQRSAHRSVHNSYAAARETRVDSQDPHEPTAVHTERMFDSLDGSSVTSVTTRRAWRIAPPDAIDDLPHPTAGVGPAASRVHMDEGPAAKHLDGPSTDEDRATEGQDRDDQQGEGNLSHEHGECHRDGDQDETQQEQQEGKPIGCVDHVRAELERPVTQPRTPRQPSPLDPLGLACRVDDLHQVTGPVP